MKSKKTLWLLFILIGCMILTGCQTVQKEITLPTVDPSLATTSVTVTFYEAGKADAILIQTDHETVMIDTGTKERAEELLSWLDEAGVTCIDVLFLSHFDKDHVGGAAAVLERYEVGTVLTTYDSKESDEIDAYRAALKKSSAVAARVVQPTVLTIDGLTYEILTAKKTYYENDTSNDSSLVVKMTFEDVSWLFAGDVEEARIQELLDSGADLSATVLKVPHHGKSEDNTKEFIQAVMPFCAVITSSDDDPEDEKTVKQLEKIDCIVFLTRLGTVTMVSDGTELNISQ